MTNKELLTKIKVRIKQLANIERELKEPCRESYSFAYLGALYDIKRYISLLEKTIS